ncbi:MAG TPA: hypothetical protein PL070_20975 [Flavobacteriales bacterium]|nr:hypothetical protein [Flavobacteriales bacterium]
MDEIEERSRVLFKAPWGILVLLFVLIGGCEGRPINSRAEVKGEYIFRYPTGQIEILTLDTDLTYHQEFYMDSSSFTQRKTPAYSNSGSWSYDRNAFRFENYLMFCYHDDPNHLLEYPEHVDMNDVYWLAPNSKHNGAISIYLETGYVFVRESESLQ